MNLAPSNATPTLDCLSAARNVDPLTDPVCRLALGAIVELTAPNRQRWADYQERIEGMSTIRRFFTLGPNMDLFSPDTVVAQFPLEQRSAATQALWKLHNAGYVCLSTHEPTEFEIYPVIHATEKGLEAYQRIQESASNNELANHTLPEFRSAP